MSLSMIQFSYKAEIVAKLIKNPEDRSIPVKNLVEKLGGRLLSFYYSYGDFDGVIIVDMPDETAGLATTLSAFSQGGLTNLKTTILIPVEKAMEAMNKASLATIEMPKG